MTANPPSIRPVLFRYFLFSFFILFRTHRTPPDCLAFRVVSPIEWWSTRFLTEFRFFIDPASSRRRRRGHPARPHVSRQPRNLQAQPRRRFDSPRHAKLRSTRGLAPPSHPRPYRPRRRHHRRLHRQTSRLCVDMVWRWRLVRLFC